MVRVLAQTLARPAGSASPNLPSASLRYIPASLLRAFQPRSIGSIQSVESGLRPIYATQSHPQNAYPGTYTVVEWREAAER